jgi:hypothetical protein
VLEFRSGFSSIFERQSLSFSEKKLVPEKV